MVKIVLDAGHGGKDPGAVANGLAEKELALHLALAAGAHLTDSYLCEVLYTRTKDIYLSPSERARLANDAGADLFCSFHINIRRRVDSRRSNTRKRQAKQRCFKFLCTGRPRGKRTGIRCQTGA